LLRLRLRLRLSGLRGCSAEIVILEEAAFMSPDMFFQVIVPLIGVKNTALLGITTPQSGFNYFNDLMNLKGADGESLFLCYKVGMVCEACTKHKRACNHKLSMNPYVAQPVCVGGGGAGRGATRCLSHLQASCCMCVCVSSHWKPPERTAKVDAMYVYARG
jgi:hypothetical protein